MPTRTIAVVASLLAAAAFVAGCAHRPAAPSQAGAAISSLDSTAPEGFVALSKRLVANRHSLFSVTQNKYSYFAGEVLLAEYEVATEILRIRSLPPDKSAIVCEYSPQGILYIDPKLHPDKTAFTDACWHCA
jgi:hypothetical protein